MLDENNSLLTAISDEECANVRGGGYGIIFNPDGSITLTSLDTGLVLGNNVTVKSSFIIDPNSPNQTISLGASDPTNSTTPSSPNSSNYVIVSLTPKFGG